MWHSREGLDINSKHLLENPDSSVTGVDVKMHLEQKEQERTMEPSNQDRAQAVL